MAERVRQMMKRSSSKMSSKGSINHIGTTPYRFKIDIFISYAENIRNVSDACITCERRGKVYATEQVKVKEGKAIFRQVLSMECTLFRKNISSKGKQDKANPIEQLDFEEKKAKMYLRKGGPQGKAVAKLALNISNYVKGASSTVFADMKLSDGTLVVTKVEATMLAMEKKKKGSQRGSEVASEMSDAQSVDDSLFGDDDDLQNAQRMMDVPIKTESQSSNGTLSAQLSPVSATPMASDQSPRVAHKLCTGLDENKAGSSAKPSNFFASVPTYPREKRLSKSIGGGYESREMGKKGKEHGFPLEEPRLTMIDQDKGMNECNSDISYDDDNDPGAKVDKSEVAKLKQKVEILKKENAKLKKARNTAVEEVESLRAELKSCELSLERHTDGRNSVSPLDVRIATLQGEVKEKDKRIAELKTRNEQLLEEMEEQHQEIRAVSKKLKKEKDARKQAKIEVDKQCEVSVPNMEQEKNSNAAESEVNALKKKVGELELALQREPEFIDVVNELKVIKVTLALANMEKEQALFELHSYRQSLGLAGSSTIATVHLESEDI